MSTHSNLIPGSTGAVASTEVSTGVDFLNDNQSQQENGRIVWFLGLSAAGKTTIAKAFQQQLKVIGEKSILLDGDQFRQIYSRDLGFTQKDRSANIIRAGKIAGRFAQSGMIVLAAFITPFENDRISLRKMFKDILYTEVFCDCPIEICKIRDPKGLYNLATKGEIANFTGISSPFEQPSRADLILPTHRLSIRECVDRIRTQVSCTGTK